MKPGYVTNCLIETKKDQEGPCFHVDGDTVNAYLDGYAIIPMEKYEDLKKLEQK